MIDAAGSTRTLAGATIVEGFFAVFWFSWADPRPLGRASIVPTAGAIVAVLVALGGIVVARRARHEPSPLAQPSLRKRHRLIIATELAAIGAGAAILVALGHDDYVAAWVCLVVGAHFVPLDRSFPGIGLVPLAAAVVCGGVTAVIVGATTSVPPDTVAGLGAGACLAGHAAALLAIADRRTRRPPPAA